MNYLGGEQRKVAIAGIIAMEPEILILDEPTVGLDPTSKNDILNKIKQYQIDKNITVIMISHDVNMIAEYVNKILILDDGKIAKYDIVNNVFSDIDLLETHGIDIPDITKIFHKLKEKGLEVNTNIYTIEQAKQEVLLYVKA